MTPATFIVSADVRPISMNTLMLRANAAAALERKMVGFRSTLGSFVTGLSSSCKAAEFRPLKAHTCIIEHRNETTIRLCNCVNQCASLNSGLEP